MKNNTDYSFILKYVESPKFEIGDEIPFGTIDDTKTIHKFFGTCKVLKIVKKCLKSEVYIFLVYVKQYPAVMPR